MCRLFDWAAEADLPVLYSCLATHAILEARHDERRRSVSPKVWGVFPHRVLVPDHPLVQGLPSEVLLARDEAGAHLAVGKTRGRWLLLQGHLEHEAVSLLKEYKREVLGWRPANAMTIHSCLRGIWGRKGGGSRAGLLSHER